MSHWTTEDDEKCAKAESLKALATIAISSLERLKKQSKTIHQIYGPMTTGGLGSLDKNMALFEQAIIVAQERGWAVFSQLPFQNAMIRLVNFHKRTTYPHEILEKFYLPVFRSRLITYGAFLPLWGTSTGASWERKTLRELSHTGIFEYPNPWYKNALRRTQPLQIFPEPKPIPSG